jgi:hypothetical protein
MKNIFIVIASLILGINLTMISFYYAPSGGSDFTFNGFPVPYYLGSWGMGMSYRFVFTNFLIDVVAWSVFSLFIIKIITILIKKIRT